MASTISYSISASSTSDSGLPDSRLSVSTTEWAKSSQLHVNNNNNIPLDLTKQGSQRRSLSPPLENDRASCARSDGPSLRRVDSHQPLNAANTSVEVEGLRRTPVFVRRVVSHEPLTSFAMDPMPMSTARKTPDLKLARRPKSPHPCAIAHIRHFRPPMCSHSIEADSRIVEDGLPKSHGALKQEFRRDKTKSQSATKVLSKAGSALNLRSTGASHVSATYRGQQCDTSKWYVRTTQKHKNGIVDNAVTSPSAEKLITSVITILPGVADQEDAANKSPGHRSSWIAKISRKGRSAKQSDSGAKLRFRVSMRDLRR